MRALFIRLGILLGMVTVTVIGPATAIAGALGGNNHNEVMASR